MNLQSVPTRVIHQVWKDVEPFIASALEHANGDYTAEQVKVYASSGEWLILVAVEDDVIHGAAAIQFFNRPNDRVAFIIAVGGRLVSSEETVAQLKVHCAAHGATIIEGAARPAIARLWARYKFEEKYRIVGVRL